MADDRLYHGARRENAFELARRFGAVLVYCALLSSMFAVAWLAPRAAFAQEAAPDRLAVLAHAAGESDPTRQADAPAPAKAAIDWGAELRKSYWIPALEILGFDFGLNRIDNRFIDRSGTYAVTLNSVRQHLTHGWVYDDDPFKVNQLGHPYQGSMYYGFARSAGLSYWESAGYTFAGSLLWEIAGETTTPSRNDQVASGIAGAFLGEPLFRMASLLLEKNEGDKFWRELGAALISPSTGFNRLAFGDRFTPVFSSRGAFYETNFSLGGSGTALTNQGVSQSFVRNEVVTDFSMQYGVPGKTDYSYSHPFDYFSFRFTGATGNGFENVMTHGLLWGRDYDLHNDSMRGVWGLYGSYDYIAPQIFRVSSTALSLGSTAEAWLSSDIALQGTALAGVGYGAAGTSHNVGDRDYHYGVTPQALLDLRLIFGQRAALDVAGRGYFVSHVASPDVGGYEKVGRVDAGFTVRVKDRHALSLRYLYTVRDATFPDLGGRNQARATIALYYTYLGASRFGPVRW